MKDRILVVDDISVNRDILAEMFEEEYEVIPASNGKEALNILSIQMGKLSAMLLDLMMPGMDGYAVLAKMQEKRLTGMIPVIVISAADSDESIEKCKQLGVKHFISRPFSKEDAKGVISLAISEFNYDEQSE